MRKRKFNPHVGQIVRIIADRSLWGKWRQPPKNAVLEIIAIPNKEDPDPILYFDSDHDLISSTSDCELVADLTKLEKVIYGLKTD